MHLRIAYTSLDLVCMNLGCNSCVRPLQYSTLLDFLSLRLATGIANSYVVLRLLLQHRYSCFDTATSSAFSHVTGKRTRLRQGSYSVRLPAGHAHGWQTAAKRHPVTSPKSQEGCPERTAY